MKPVLDLNIFSGIPQLPCTGEQGFKFQIYPLSKKELQHVNALSTMVLALLHDNREHFQHLL
jgi:hypothetical protein